MDPHLTRSLADLRRRERLATCLELFSWHWSVALLGLGTLLLLWGVAADPGSRTAAAVFSVSALTPLSAYWMARRRFLSDESVAAWMDLRAGAGGRIVTAWECADTRWSPGLPDPSGSCPGPPRLRWGAPLARILFGICFASLVAWSISWERSEAFESASSYRPAIEVLAEQLAVLEEVVELKEERARELREGLARLAEQAHGPGAPEAVFEAIDRFGGELERSAWQARDAAEAALSSLESANARAESAPGEARADLESAFEELRLAFGGELQLEAVAELDAAVEEELVGQADLDPRELRELSLRLESLVQQRMAALGDAGLLDGGSLERRRIGDDGLSDSLSISPSHSCDASCRKPGGT